MIPEQPNRATGITAPRPGSHRVTVLLWLDVKADMAFPADWYPRTLGPGSHTRRNRRYGLRGRALPLYPLPNGAITWYKTTPPKRSRSTRRISHTSNSAPSGHGLGQCQSRG